MAADILTQLGAYLHDVFVMQIDGWVLLGLIAQAMFTGRFLVQWIASERAGRSVVPVAFWFFSIAGGFLLLVYALWRRDPVFIIGQAAGLFVYLRNLWFIRREKRERAAEVDLGLR